MVVMVNFMLGIFYHENQKPILIKQLLPIFLSRQPSASTLAVFRVLVVIAPLTPDP